MVKCAISVRTRHAGGAEVARGPAGRTRPGRGLRTGRGVRIGLRAALLGALLVIGAAVSEAQPPVKQVLMLQSLNRGNLTLDRFTGEFRVRLDELAGEPVNVVQVVVGPTGFIGAPEPVLVDYIQSLYADRAPPDLIVTVGGPAALFARKHRQQLFPATPLLFGAMDQRYLRDSPLGENETAVAVVNDLPALIDDILRVLPETRQIFMVTGSGAIGRFMRPELETGFARFRGRVSFIWSDQMSLSEILQRVASLPPHSSIVYQTFGSDAQGTAYPAEQVITSLHARANAPLFSAQSPYLGRGVVGGSMMNIDDLGRRTAEVGVRILNGEPPGRIRVPPQLRGPPTYDWRELQRWNIPESRLPPGSVVQFRRPSLWDEHRVTVVTVAVALILQSLLITRLLYERRARQRAEIESRQNLALAADANRRETMSALTTSIGHELGQPLAAITQNAEVLRMMVATDGAAPEGTGEIVADIQAETALAKQIIGRHRAMLRGRQLNRQPVDLHSVIEESVALVAHDMRLQRIGLTLELTSAPGVVDGDQVLLQQVLVNLLRNAMEALPEAPPGRRHIAIRSVVGDAEVAVSVSDTGGGLPPEILGKLFSPFVTTKTQGLGIGLTVSRRIVEAHDGTIDAHENPDGGATFTVTLPRSAARELPAVRPGAGVPS
jgi:signal transduction histidine kinase